MSLVSCLDVVAVELLCWLYLMNLRSDNNIASCLKIKTLGTGHWLAWVLYSWPHAGISARWGCVALYDTNPATILKYLRLLVKQCQSLMSKGPAAMEIEPGCSNIWGGRKSHADLWNGVGQRHSVENAGTRWYGQAWSRSRCKKYRCIEATSVRRHSETTV